jgi:hypothetical protein
MQHVAVGGPGQRYDLVVLDPPWENASARRAAHYPTLPSRNLLAIPMRRLLRPVHRGRALLLSLMGMPSPVLSVFCRACSPAAEPSSLDGRAAGQTHAEQR